MHATVKLRFQRGIDEAMLFDSRFAGKGGALDPDAEMRLDTPRMNAGVTAMLIRLVDHIKPVGLERFR
jgi:hypothetical protein